MTEIVYRGVAVGEFGRLAEIDRTEPITRGYLQHGDRLEEIEVEWSAPPWFSDDDGEHSIRYQRTFCERHLAAGGTALGCFQGERLVGIGIVTPHIRPGIAQLAYLQVSHGYRGRGIGSRLVAWMEWLAREAGDTQMVVSATPSKRTVDFYRGCGFDPTAEPLPELYALEPEDVHLSKALA
jgi:GNAT superfamily N-acetyltransferase